MEKIPNPSLSPVLWLKRRVPSILALVILLLLGLLLYLAAQPEAKAATVAPTEFMEYEKAVVVEVLSDSCTEDPVAENSQRGSQTITARVETGRYAGKVLLTDNTVGPVYGQSVAPGDHIVVGISTYSDGTIRSAVYEYDRCNWIWIILGVFLLATVLVGGKVGAKSLLGLVLTVAALLWVLIPLLLKGWATIPTAFLVSAWVACVSFVILGGVNRKTLCAALGTLAGIALATGFGLLAQHLLRINGYRQEYAEALLQLRQTGESSIGISGLVVAGVIISALGAVMDVAMSISSSMQELARVGENLTPGRLWKSGMNIGRDMVGTMTNTLILAIIGSGLTLIVYIYSLGLQVNQFLSSPYLSLEVISGIASSIGVILAVPLTAGVCALAYGKKQPAQQ